MASLQVGRPITQLIKEAVRAYALTLARRGAVCSQSDNKAAEGGGSDQAKGGRWIVSVLSGQFLDLWADLSGSFIFPLDVKMGYNSTMTAKLTKELADALNATGDSELEVVDPSTQRTVFRRRCGDSSTGNGRFAPVSRIVPLPGNRRNGGR
ncbi:MAG: hypothetical protein R3C49_21765 [Planctomycetaceae bacterium]